MPDVSALCRQISYFMHRTSHQSAIRTANPQFAAQGIAPLPPTVQLPQGGLGEFPALLRSVQR